MSFPLLRQKFYARFYDDIYKMQIYNEFNLFPFGVNIEAKNW